MLEEHGGGNPVTTAFNKPKRLPPHRLQFTMMKCLSTFILCLGLMSCSGLTRLSSASMQFSQSVTTARTAELAFLTDVRKVECDSTFYQQAFQFAIGKTDQLDLLSDTCHNQILTDDQLKLRTSFFDTLGQYADLLKEISSSPDSATIDTKFSSLASSSGQLASKFGETQTTEQKTATAISETVMINIAELLLDHVKQKDISQSINDPKYQAALRTAIETLKAENIRLDAARKSYLTLLNAEYRAPILRDRQENGFAVFIRIMSIRAAVRDTTSSKDAVDQLNHSLDAIITASDALAHVNVDALTTEDASTAINRGKGANSTFNTLKR